MLSPDHPCDQLVAWTDFSAFQEAQYNSDDDETDDETSVARQGRPCTHYDVTTNVWRVGLLGYIQSVVGTHGDEPMALRRTAQCSVWTFTIADLTLRNDQQLHKSCMQLYDPYELIACWEDELDDHPQRMLDGVGQEHQPHCIFCLERITLIEELLSACEAFVRWKDRYYPQVVASTVSHLPGPMAESSDDSSNDDVVYEEDEQLDEEMVEFADEPF